MADNIRIVTGGWQPRVFIGEVTGYETTKRDGTPLMAGRGDDAKQPFTKVVVRSGQTTASFPLWGTGIEEARKRFPITGESQEFVFTDTTRYPNLVLNEVRDI